MQPHEIGAGINTAGPAANTYNYKAFQLAGYLARYYYNGRSKTV